MTADHVIFGTGPIGRAIAEELIGRGESVRMLNRSGKMDEAPAGAEVSACDLYDSAQVKQATRGARVAYQAAQPNYFAWQEKFPPLQKSIIDGLTGSDVKLVLVENLYMYGETNGAPLTEDAPHNAQTRKGKVRAEMSRAAFDACREGKLRVTAGRGSDFFGAWGTLSAMGERAIAPLLKGKSAQLTGNIDLPHTFTYVKDFGKALVILGERAEADGQAWHVPNDMPQVTQREMIKMFAEEAGVTPKTSSIGKMGMTLAGFFIPAAKETVEMMYEFEQPFVVDSSKFEKTFGIKATPMREAVRETVRWYKRRPEAKQ